MEDIKKLQKLLDEYKQIGKEKSPKKMSQGGMYNDGYAEGGKVSKEEKAPHNNKNLKKLKAAFDEFINEEGKEGYADGGTITDDSSYNPFLNVIHKMGQSFSSSPSTSPSPKSSPSSLDQKYQKIRDEQEADRSRTAADSYSDGGRVPGSFTGKGYDEGGKVDASNDSDDHSDDSKDSSSEDKPGLSPEEFDKHLKDLKDKGYDLKHVNGDDQLITIKPSKSLADMQGPASEQDLTPENPDDKALEDQMQNEELQGQMEADKGEDNKDTQDQEDEDDEDRQVASDSSAPTDKSSDEEDEDQAAPDQGSTLQPQAQQEAPQSSLQQALAKAQSQRKLALLAEGQMKADALLGAGIAGHGATPASTAYMNNQALAEVPIKNIQEQLSIQKDDPSSPVSAVVRSYLENKGLKVPPNASADDLFKVAPFLAKDQQLVQQMQKAIMQIQARAQQGEANRKASMERTQQQGKNIENAAHIRADAMKQMTDQRSTMQGQRLAGQVVQRVNNDPVAKPSLQNMASLEKSKRLLENTNVPLTPQVLADAEQDIASGMQIRGMGGSEGKINRTTLNTIGRQIALAKQKYLNRPDIDLRKEEPELVNQIYKTNQALMDDYQQTIQERKQQIAEEYRPMAGDNPQINKAIDQYVKSPGVTAKGLHAPGSTVLYKGKQYTVGADGNTLEPKGQQGQ